MGATRRHRFVARRHAAARPEAVLSILRGLSHQAANHERAIRAGPVEGLARQPRGRHGRVHQHRNLAHARFPISVRAYPDRCDRRVPENRASPESARAGGALSGSAPEGRMNMRDADSFRHAKRFTLAAVAAAGLAATALIPLSAQAADALLSGSITSAAGEKLAGVTVSAKQEGATITTTVFTDDGGNYYFPPLPAGEYRVWAQALTFATAKDEVDLGAAKHQDFKLSALQ